MSICLWDNMIVCNQTALQQCSIAACKIHTCILFKLQKEDFQSWSCLPTRDVTSTPLRRHKLLGTCANFPQCCANWTSFSSKFIRLRELTFGFYFHPSKHGFLATIWTSNLRTCAYWVLLLVCWRKDVKTWSPWASKLTSLPFQTAVRTLDSS